METLRATRALSDLKKWRINTPICVVYHVEVASDVGDYEHLNAVVDITALRLFHQEADKSSHSGRHTAHLLRLACARETLMSSLDSFQSEMVELSRISNLET